MAQIFKHTKEQQEFNNRTAQDQQQEMKTTKLFDKICLHTQAGKRLNLVGIQH